MWSNVSSIGPSSERNSTTFISKKLVENDKNLKNELVDESTRAKIRTSEMTDKIQDLCNTYGRLALEGLENFPSSEAKTCLKNFVKYLIVLKSVS